MSNDNRILTSDIKAAASQMVRIYEQAMQQGNSLEHVSSGAAIGQMLVPGRGDGSLDESLRLAQPQDPAMHHHMRMNALQDDIYVHTVANRYPMNGVIVVDATICQTSGGDSSLYERGDLARGASQVFIELCHELEHEVTVFVSLKHGEHKKISARDSRYCLGAMNNLFLKQYKHQPQQDGSQAKHAGKFNLTMSKVAQATTHGNIDFVIVVSDFLNQGWQTSLLKMAASSYLSKIVTVQVVDPWDLSLPASRSAKRKNIVHLEIDGEIVTADLSNPQHRRVYEEAAARKQADIEAMFAQVDAWHLRVRTDRLFLDQMVDLARG